MKNPTTVAARLYPDGLPGLLSMGQFEELMGISRPTALKIVKEFPAYLTPRGNTNLIGVGLYFLLSKDPSFSNGESEER